MRRRIEPLSPRFETLECRWLLSADPGLAQNAPSPHVLWAPDTSAEQIENWLNQTGWEDQFAAVGADITNIDGNRWTTTATDGSGLGQGDVTTLTWSVVPDGTFISGFAGEPSAPSDLRARLDGLYGSMSAWLPLLQQVFDDWEQVTGIDFVYESNDDGVSISGFNRGVLGTRGDIRIGGHFIDGNSGILAYNFFPNTGDMVIDTADSYFSNLSNNSRRLRNVTGHEVGHGIGMEHTIPSNGTKLMEPFASTAFDGPQFDDVLRAQRGYGDALEDNDAPGEATILGPLADQPVVISGVSIDDDSDPDYYTFSVGASTLLDITLDPFGFIYTVGIEDSTTESFDARAQSDLTLTLLGSDGSTVLANVNTGGLGASEMLIDYTLSAGQYYIRITGAQNTAQRYTLTLGGDPLSTDTAEIHGVVFNDLDGDGQRDGGEPGLSGWTVFLDDDADGALDGGETSVLTTADGSYAFLGLAAGDYTVVQLVEPGWQQTSPAGGGFLQLVSQWDGDAGGGGQLQAPGEVSNNAGDGRIGHHEDHPDKGGGEGDKYADVWGGGDFAYLGHYQTDSSVEIIDISDPANPSLAAVWIAPVGGLRFQDVKVHNGIGYFGSDAGGGLYTVDVSDPYNPVTLAHIGTADGGLNNIHNVSVDGGYLYEADSRTRNVAVFDVSDPANPFHVRTLLASGNVHDVTASNGRLYASVISSSGFTDIFDVSDVANAAPLLGSFSSGPASHSNWPTPDGQYVVSARETSGGDVRIYDVSNPASVQLVSTISMAAYGIDAFCPHNPVVVGDHLYVSWYQAGVVAFDISDPANPVLLGSYDTFPGPVSGFDGNWGVYPLLGPDRILASDMNGGLFVLAASETSAVHNVTLAQGQIVTGLDFGNQEVDPNDPPNAVNDAFIVAEDSGPTVFAVLSNDTDPDGDALTITGATQGAHGSVTINGGQTVTYTPAANYFGGDSFTYTISDGNGGVDTAVVSVTVTAVNDAPTAAADAYSVTAGQTLTVSAATGVLANDSDIDGGALSASLLSGPASAASFQLNADGSFTYTPAAGFDGVDGFSYTVSDGLGGTDTAAVTITVNPDTPGAPAGAFIESGGLVVVEAEHFTAQQAGAGSAASHTWTQITTVSDSSDGAAVHATPNTGVRTDDAINGPRLDYDINFTTTGTYYIWVRVEGVTANDDSVHVGLDGAAASLGQWGVYHTGTWRWKNDNGATRVTVQVATPGVHTLNMWMREDGTRIDKLLMTTNAAFTPTGQGPAESERATGEPGNEPPIAVDDQAATDEDTPVIIGVLANDSDPEADPLTILSVSQGADGSVVHDGGGVTYTPNADFHGADSFTYTITDGQGGTDTATVSVTVNPVNDDPVANDDAAVTNEDAPIVINVLSNDGDVDGDALSIIAVTQGANGAVTTNGATVTYTPNANFNGGDSFTYTVTDGAGGTDTATVSVTVNPINDAPVASDDAAATDEDTPLVLSTAQLLANDTDIDGDALSISSVHSAVNGGVVLNGGQITFTPNADFHGAASFTYTVSDGAGGTDTATVSVTVNPVNDAPVAVDDGYSTPEEAALVVSAVAGVLVNDGDADGDALTASLLAGPANGSLSLNPDGSFTYTPDAEFAGTDSFTYTVSDGHGGTDTAAVTIDVTAANDPPVAADDSAVTDEDAAVIVNVLPNDSDPDGDGLAIVAVTQGTNGAVSTDGATVTYTPHADFNGDDSFTYTISDGRGGTDTATVSVTVSPVNDAPVAVDDAAATDEDTPLVLSTAQLLGNDTDIDGDALSIASVHSAVNGGVVLDGGQVTFTPNADFHGGASFQYTIADGGGGFDTATVSITVHPINDAPVAADDAAATNEDTPVVIGVLVNDGDIDGDALSIIGVTQGAAGSVSTDGAAVTYTPSGDFSGGDAFTYTVTDGAGGTDTATVSVTVNPVNDPPVAVDDVYAVDEDGVLVVAAASGVLVNDTDVEGDALTAALVSGPASGQVTLNPDGSFTYTPDADFNGTDGFTYVANDGDADSDPATVSITINPINDDPTVVNPLADQAAAEDTPFSFTVPVDTFGDVDGDALTLTAQLTGGGSLPAWLGFDGQTFSGTPAQGDVGSFAVTVTADDGEGGATDDTFTITVADANDPPVAQDDAASTDEDTPLVIAAATLLANDGDVDGDALSIVSVHGAVNGGVALNGDQITFTPHANFSGVASFQYTASDGRGGTDAATVTVTVNPVNDAPTAAADAYSVTGGQTLTVSAATGVLANDSDIDGGALSASLLSGPASASSFQLNADGSFTYTPAAGFDGVDGFTYTVSDGLGGTDTAAVTITVEPAVPTGAFIESGGLVVVEAEHFTAQQPGTGSAAPHSWTESTTIADSSNGAAVVAGPNLHVRTDDAINGPRLDYDINFTTTGTYYIWVRVEGVTANDDSVHVGLDGAAASLGQWGVYHTGTWRWKNDNGATRVTVQVTTPGVHTLNMWMREDGTRIDKLLMTTNAAFTPLGQGPAESERQGDPPVVKGARAEPDAETDTDWSSIISAWQGSDVSNEPGFDPDAQFGGLNGASVGAADYAALLDEWINARPAGSPGR